MASGDEELNMMNGLVMMPSKTCTATREAMRKEDEAGESLRQRHKSKMDDNRTSDSGTTRCLKYIGVLCTYVLSIAWSEAFGLLALDAM